MQLKLAPLRGRKQPSDSRVQMTIPFKVYLSDLH